MADRPRRNLLCFGATSAIASAYLKRRAQQGGWTFTLVGRDADRLRTLGQELASEYRLVIADFADRDALLGLDLAALGPVDEALVAFAALENQTEVGANQEIIARQFDLNLTNTALLIEALAAQLLVQATPDSRLVVIGSTAADRARPTNYAYGASKAGLEFFCDGLRYHLEPRGIAFTFVKPGLADSAMTRAANRPKTLMVSPERIARDMLRAIERGKSVVYTPWFWWWITALGRLLPRRVIARVRS